MEVGRPVNLKSMPHGFNSTLNLVLDALDRSGLSVVEQIDLSGHLTRYPSARRAIA
jgi:hypothetical protein